MRVTTRTWHGRVYRYWANHFLTGYDWRLDNPRRRQENLCHYTRVVLLYAPVLWFLTAQPWRLRWVRPWMPAALLTFATVVAVGVVRWPAGTWRATWTGALVLACICAGVGALAGLEYTVERWRERPSRPDKPYRGPSFAVIAWEWTKAKKRRVCPLVEVVDHAGERT